MGLIDDFVQNVNRELNKVQTRGQEMMHTYQLTTQIRVLEGKKNATLIEIGRLVYEKNQHGKEASDEVLNEKCREITGYEHEIQVLQAEADKIKAQYDP